MIQALLGEYQHYSWHAWKTYLVSAFVCWWCEYVAHPFPNLWKTIGVHYSSILAVTWPNARPNTFMLTLLIPHPGALACRNRSSCSVCEAIDPVLVLQWWWPLHWRSCGGCQGWTTTTTCTLSGPWTSRLHNPACIWVWKNICFVCKHKCTMCHNLTIANADWYPWCIVWVMNSHTLY